MSQHYQPQLVSAIEQKSSQSTAALLPRPTPHLPPNTNTTAVRSLGIATPGSLLGIYNSNSVYVPAIPTSVESSDAAKAHSLQPLPDLLPIESPNNTAEPDADGLSAGEGAAVCRIPGNFLTAIEHTSRGGDDEEVEGEGEGEEEGQKYTNNDSSSSDSIAFSYVCRLSAHVESLTVFGRPHRKPNRHRRQRQRSRECRNQTNISARPADLTSRITDWIPPPPELPLSPKLLDPAVAAAYPLPPSRACSEPTPSSHQPPPQLPPYPAVPRSAASPSSHGTGPRKLPRLKVSPSLASSATTDITWGPDSPLTSALRLKRATDISALPPPSPTHSVSSQDTNSTRVTDVEAELGALEEVGRTEALRQHVLLWRLIAERDGGGIECSRSR